MMGSGGLVVMDDGNCMVDVAKFFMDFIQRESCGKCIPCREGTRRMLEILESLTPQPAERDRQFEALERFRGVMNLEHLAEVIQDTSLCGLGQSAPNPVLEHAALVPGRVRGARLRSALPDAKACRELLVYEIDADALQGLRALRQAVPVGRDRRHAEEPAPHHPRALRGVRDVRRRVQPGCGARCS